MSHLCLFVQIVVFCENRHSPPSACLHLRVSGAWPCWSLWQVLLSLHFYRFWGCKDVRKTGCVTECEVSCRVPAVPSSRDSQTLLQWKTWPPEEEKAFQPWAPFFLLGNPLLPVQAKLRFSSHPAAPATESKRELPRGWAASPPTVTLCWQVPRTSIPADWLLLLHRGDGAAPSPPWLGYVRVVRATVNGPAAYPIFPSELWAEYFTVRQQEEDWGKVPHQEGEAGI